MKAPAPAPFSTCWQPQPQLKAHVVHLVEECVQRQAADGAA